MDVELIEDKKNVLLKRREVKFSVKYAGSTPSRDEVRKKLASVLSSDLKLTVLDYVKSDYGRHNAMGYAKVYDNAEGMTVEPSYRIKRNFEAKKKAEEGEAKEAVPAPKDAAHEAVKEKAHEPKEKAPEAVKEGG